MRYFLTLVAILALATVAGAQSRNGMTAGGASGSVYGGGGYGGGYSGGSPSAPLPHVPPAVFNSMTVSGDGSFAPSAFMSWEEAVALGKPKTEKSLGEVAREYRKQKEHK